MSVFERGTGKLEITDAERIERLNSRVAKLQAELVEKENAIYQYNVWSSADIVKIAKLQAVVDAAKTLLANVKRGTPVDLVAWEQQRDIAEILEQAIKEVESE